MKKTYTKPEISVSKFNVETSITTEATLSANLVAGIYADAEGNLTKDAVAVVDYTKIFSKN